MANVLVITKKEYNYCKGKVDMSWFDDILFITEKQRGILNGKN